MRCCDVFCPVSVDSPVRSGATVAVLLFLFAPAVVAGPSDRLVASLYAESQGNVSDRGVDLDASDFRRHLADGLAFAAPGRRAVDLRCLADVPWSPAVAPEVMEFLRAEYAHMLDVLGPDWPAKVRRTLDAESARIALLSWSLVTEGSTEPVQSIAIFGAGDRLLYDSVASHLITGVEDAGSHVVRRKGIRLTGSDFVERRRTISSAGGSVEMIWRVSLTAGINFVPADSNSAFGYLETGELDLRRGSTTGLFPPGGDPIVYFGTGGRYADNIANTVPFVSRVTLFADAFGAGQYTIDAREAGSNFSLSISVGAKGVSVGIAFDPEQPLSFASEDNKENVLLLGNRLYFEALPGFKYRGVFRDGGHLNVYNLGIQYRDDDDREAGTLSVSLPVQFGYETTVLGAAGTLNYAIGESSETLRASAQYVRPDALRSRQPTYTMVSTRQSVSTGDELEVVVRVKNESEEFSIESGTVRIVESSVNEHLELLDEEGFTRDLGTIEPRNAKNFIFRLRARDGEGLVSPEARIRGNWQFPVRVDDFEGEVGVSERIRVNLGDGPINNSGGFVRGDVNADGVINIADALSGLNFLFAGGSPLDCLDAADINDDGTLNISDPPYLLTFQFAGGSRPPDPFGACGLDPTDDDLDCLLFEPCAGEVAPSAELIAHYEMDVTLETEDGVDRYTPNEIEDGVRAFQLRGGPSPKPQPARDRFEPEEEVGAMHFTTTPGENGILTLGYVDYGDSFSLCAWIYLDEGGGRKHLLGQRDFMSMWMPQNLQGMHFTIQTLDGDEYEVGETEQILRQTWYFFVATVEYDGQDTAIRIYRDGELTASRVVEGIRFVNVDNLESTIGAEFNCGTTRRSEVQGPDARCQTWYGYRGRIDDVRIYRGAIPDSTVEELYREDGWTGND